MCRPLPLHAASSLPLPVSQERRILLLLGDPHIDTRFAGAGIGIPSLPAPPPPPPRRVIKKKVGGKPSGLPRLGRKGTPRRKRVVPDEESMPDPTRGEGCLDCVVGSLDCVVGSLGRGEGCVVGRGTGRSGRISESCVLFALSWSLHNPLDVWGGVSGGWGAWVNRTEGFVSWLRIMYMCCSAPPPQCGVPALSVAFVAIWVCNLRGRQWRRRLEHGRGA